MDTVTVTVKDRAEEIAVQLLANGLNTDDPDLQPLCDRLRPFLGKLGGVDRALIQRGLAMVSVDPALHPEAAAKKCLEDLVDQLDAMRRMFGLL